MYPEIANGFSYTDDSAFCVVPRHRQNIEPVDGWAKSLFQKEVDQRGFIQTPSANLPSFALLDSASAPPATIPSLSTVTETREREFANSAPFWTSQDETISNTERKRRRSLRDLLPILTRSRSQPATTSVYWKKPSPVPEAASISRPLSCPEPAYGRLELRPRSKPQSDPNTTAPRPQSGFRLKSQTLSRILIRPLHSLTKRGSKPSARADEDVSAHGSQFSRSHNSSFSPNDGEYILRGTEYQGPRRTEAIKQKMKKMKRKVAKTSFDKLEESICNPPPSNPPLYIPRHPHEYRYYQELEARTHRIGFKCSGGRSCGCP